MEIVHPQVIVAVSPQGADPALLREILWGLEEESVPFRVVELPGSCEQMAQEASLISPLGAGVAIGEDGWVIVQHRRLPRSKPLFRLLTRGCPARLVRELGANAARLVKGIPFKLAGSEESR